VIGTYSPQKGVTREVKCFKNEVLAVLSIIQIRTMFRRALLSLTALVSLAWAAEEELGLAHAKDFKAKETETFWHK
jgi:hypothetical protein